MKAEARICCCAKLRQVAVAGDTEDLHAFLLHRVGQCANAEAGGVLGAEIFVDDDDRKAKTHGRERYCRGRRNQTDYRRMLVSTASGGILGTVSASVTRCYSAVGERSYGESTVRNCWTLGDSQDISRRSYQRLLIVFVALLAGCGTASAQPQSSDSPPLIAGRVSVAEGDVQIWRAEEDADGQWDLAQINDVVTVGTGLYTGSNGRTQFRVGPNTYHLSSGSRGGFTSSTTAAPCSIWNTAP